MLSQRVTVDSPPRTGDPQLECPGEPVEPGSPGTSPTPIYHDPHPPFETDGRGRVVWSNSSGQARLRSRSSPSVQPRMSSNDETDVTREKENSGMAGPGIEIGDGGNGEQEAGVGGAMAGVQRPIP